MVSSHRILVVLAASLVGALGISACGGAAAPPRSTGPTAPSAGGPTPASANPASDYQLSQSRAAFQSAIRVPWPKTDFSRHVVPLRQFERGGPVPDGIPPLDEARTTTTRTGSSYLMPRDPVIAVVVDGHARAYPLRILIWHEIANDILGGRPIVVTYCPLCNSAQVFDRRVGGRVLRFGTTGNLRGSDLVMWDRQTQSWWQQIGGEGLVGHYAGTRLRPIAAQMISWGEFKRRYPHGSVLSKRTGFDRPYGTTAYVGYDTPSGEPRFSTLHVTHRLPPLERVAAVTVAHETIAVPFAVLDREPVAEASVGGRPMVVLYYRGAASALDRHRIAGSRAVGVATAFDRRVSSRTLDFDAGGHGTFTDRQTHSTWDLTGRAVAGPLRGAQLRPLAADNRFWFAVADFDPHVRIIR